LVGAGTLDENASAAETPAAEDKYNLLRYDITPTPYERTVQLTPAVTLTADTDSDVLVFETELNASQHYRTGIAAHVLSGNPVVELSSGGVSFGAFFIEEFDVPQTAGTGETAPQSEPYFFLEPIYLSSGSVELTFTALRGSVEISRVIVEDTEAVSVERFDVTRRLVTPAPSAEANELFGFLGEQFGKRILTAQHVTYSTGNAEIEAVYRATGRKPAVRFGDTDFSVQSRTDRELERAKEWHADGGIVGYTWIWSSPGGGSHYADQTDFTLNAALVGAANSGVEQMPIEFVDEMAESGEITHELALMIRAVDNAAAFLLELQSEGIPVLWNPLPDGGSSLYWWGAGGGDAYVQLWRLMYDRLISFHGINNLIWVWSGGSLSCYPGDNRVDIIGESIFDGGGSGAVKFGYTAGYVL
jgi:mannan endo-1,4-beta-mannosidase